MLHSLRISNLETVGLLSALPWLVSQRRRQALGPLLDAEPVAPPGPPACPPLG